MLPGDSQVHGRERLNEANVGAVPISNDAHIESL
jgi:hypothetical protein